MLCPALIEYSIETKIRALVDDNAGSNDVLCCTIGQWLSLEYKINWIATHQRIRCQGHIINLIVQAFLFSSKKDEKLIALYDKKDEKQNKEEEEEEEEEVVQQAPPLIKRKDKKKKKDEESELASDKKYERGKNI
jgi:hypothetical protein